MKLKIKKFDEFINESVNEDVKDSPFFQNFFDDKKVGAKILGIADAITNISKDRDFTEKALKELITYIAQVSAMQSK